MAAAEKKERRSLSARSGLQFPVGRIKRYLKKGRFANRVGIAGAIYLAAAIENLVAELVEQAGNSANENKRLRIKPRDILLGFSGDEDLMKIIGHNTIIAGGGVVPFIHAVLVKPKNKKKIQESPRGGLVSKGARKAASGGKRRPGY